MQAVQTARRLMYRELHPHRYAILSALIKSMRVQRPADALYYYHLLTKTPEFPPSQILRRLLGAAGEDSMSPWVLVDAADVWHDRNDWADETVEARKVALVVSIASLPNSYTTGEYGQMYCPSKWPNIEKDPPRTKKRVRRELFDTPPLRHPQAEFYRVLTAFLHTDDHCSRAEQYEWLGEFLTQRIAAHKAWQFQMEPLRDAYHRILGDLWRMDPGMGWNWWTRCIFLACVGPPDGPSTAAATERAPLLNAKVLQRVKEDLQRGVLRMPTYAYDGRHARPGWHRGQKVVDHRFAGTTTGVANMFAMAARDGKLDIRQQGIKTRCQPWMLAKPFIPVKL